MVNRHSTFPKGILIIYCLLVLTTCGCKSRGGDEFSEVLVMDTMAKEK